MGRIVRYHAVTVTVRAVETKHMMAGTEEGKSVLRQTKGLKGGMRFYRYCGMNEYSKAVPLPPRWRQGGEAVSSYAFLTSALDGG
jgi:hypothetical protein